MTNLESWVLSYLLNSFWQIPVLFAAGMLAARALRRVGSTAEHRLWVTVLLLETLLPACSVLPPGGMRGLLARIWNSGAQTPPGPHVTVVMGPGLAWGVSHLSADLAAAMVILYLAVVAWFTARFVWRCTQLPILRRDSLPVILTGEAAGCWAECRSHFGIRAASLASSRRIFAPLTMGIFRKLVLLPEGTAGKLSESEIRTVLAHECAHMRRNDFLKNLLCELLSLPASYHPLLALTRANVSESREIVCDQMAAEMAGRSCYARSLLRLASLLGQAAPARAAHTMGIFDTRMLERRLMKLTEKRTETRGPLRLAAVLACIALGLGTCASALALHLHVDGIAAASKKSAPPTRPVEVSSSVMAAQRISGPVPKYPVDAKKAGIQGTVTLIAIIGKDGTVENLRVESGPKELQSSAIDAVRQWIYKPFLLNGEPVEVKTTIHVTYSLRK